MTARSTPPKTRSLIESGFISLIVFLIGSLLVYGFTNFDKKSKESATKADLKEAIILLKQDDSAIQSSLQKQIDKKVDQSQYNELKELLIINVNQTNEINKYLRTHTN